MAKTWSFRSAGVLLRNGKILVQRERDGEEYALPGGSIEFGETSKQALVREYAQETGADVSCGRLLWIEESFRRDGGKKTSELNFYYMVELSGEGIPDTGKFMPQKDNERVLYGWLPLENIDKVKIYPEFLGNEILNLEKYPKHFISNYC
ncbi:MAG: NUDIX domain-containing protein [Clostridia bacterium]|nr:NUDIX domain-containing protein [Clostridia bacterium]